MKKVLIASDCFLPRIDGVSRFLEEFIKSIKDYYRIKVIAPDFKGNKENFGVDVVRVPLTRISFSDFPVAGIPFRKMKQLVRESDIVFSNSIGPIGGLAIYYGKKYGKVVICYKHSLEWELFPGVIRNKFLKRVVGEVTRSFLKYLCNRCDLIIVPSRGIGNILSKEGIKTKKVIIPLGVDTEKFFPIDNKAKAKLRLNINPKDIVIGYCGRISREKGVLMLYEVFLRLKKRFKNLKLLIVG